MADQNVTSIGDLLQAYQKNIKEIYQLLEKITDINDSIIVALYYSVPEQTIFCLRQELQLSVCNTQVKIPGHRILLLSIFNSKIAKSTDLLHVKA